MGCANLTVGGQDAEYTGSGVALSPIYVPGILALCGAFAIVPFQRSRGFSRTPHITGYGLEFCLSFVVLFCTARGGFRERLGCLC